MVDRTMVSEILGREVGLRVWRPGGAVAAERRLPVVVGLDAEVFVPVGGGGVPEWVETLSAEGVMPAALVVGVVTGADPALDFSLEDAGGGEGFARFVGEELVAWIDANERTLGSPGGRILVGAGLGALNALRVALGGGGVFSKVACLSTSFEDVSQSLPEDAGMLRWIAELERLPEGVRAYFDYGTLGLDECYSPYHAELGSLLRERGWRDGREFSIEQVAGGTQSAGSWRERVGGALRFLCAGGA